MTRIRLTMAQALVRYLAAQRTPSADGTTSLFAGVFAIFGHGNVAGLGEALESTRARLPVWRAHNEQAMAHAAIGFAKASRRRRMLACTSSVGPGATNMVTAAALAHVNRLPLLLLPGDTFASRRPEPVLQQIEDFSAPGVTANDCFRPVSRFWDRIARPEQLLTALPQAISVLTDPADCGPVTLALPQDVQAEACDYPEEFFEPRVHALVRAGPDVECLRTAAEWIRSARRPLVIAGGGVHYSDACAALRQLVEKLHLPVAETQAGKGALPWDHPCNVGAIGVTGSSAANALAARADLVIAVGTRLQDFTTGSQRLFRAPAHRVLAINVCRHDAIKAGALALQADARRALEELSRAIASAGSESTWFEQATTVRQAWLRELEDAIADRGEALPSDAQVLGLVNQVMGDKATVVCAAGGLPGELHKLWRTRDPDGYHVEYGYSCMGYEIAGGLGVKLALPQREVTVLVGDGSYLMMNSEIATSIAMGCKLLIVVLDNRGFGCINRLQQACGGEPYNNLLSATPAVDFAAHARSLGAQAEKVPGLKELGPALARARACERTAVVVIETDPARSTAAGGAWWDVPVAQVSDSDGVRAAYRSYREHLDDGLQKK